MLTGQHLVVVVPVGLGVFIVGTLYLQGRVPGTYPFIRRHVRHINPTMRIMAARAMGRISQGSVLFLLQELSRDQDQNVRAEAAISLGTRSEEEARQSLTTLLDDPSSTVRRVAVRGLEAHADATLAPSLARTLLDADSGVRMAAIRAMGHIRDAGAAESLARLLPTNNEAIRIAIEEALQRIGQPAFETLIRLLPESGQAAESLVDIMLKLDRAGSFAPLEAVLSASHNPEVVHQAALGLIRIGNPRTLEILVAHLQNPEAVGREYVAGALGHFPNPTIIAPLCQVLFDTDPKVRRMAARVLAETRQNVPVEPLARAIADDEKDVACQAAMALGRQNDPNLILEAIRVLFPEELEASDQFQEIMGGPLPTALTTYYDLVRVLERLASQPYSPEILHFKEMLQALVIILYRNHVRAFRDTSTTITLIIKGAAMASSIKEEHLHPLARAMLIFVRDSMEAGRWQEAGV